MTDTELASVRCSKMNNHGGTESTKEQHKRNDFCTFATCEKNVISLQNLGPFAPGRSASRLPDGVSANHSVQKCPGFAKSNRVDVAKLLFLAPNQKEPRRHNGHNEFRVVLVVSSWFIL